MAGTFAICKDCSGQFRFWLKSRNGEIVAVASRTRRGLTSSGV